MYCKNRPNLVSLVLCFLFSEKAIFIDKFKSTYIAKKERFSGFNWQQTLIAFNTKYACKWSVHLFSINDCFGNTDNIVQWILCVCLGYISFSTWNTFNTSICDVDTSCICCRHVWYTLVVHSEHAEHVRITFAIHSAYAYQNRLTYTDVNDVKQRIGCL